MKLTMLVLALPALLGAAEAPVRNDESKAPANPIAEQATAKSALLSRVRELATRGNLFEPDSVAQILDMKLQSQTETRPPRDCGDGTATSMAVTNLAPTELSWFRELPSGAGHIEIPAFSINPATTSGDPKVEYHIYHSVECADWPRMRDHKSARVSLNGLPAYSCLAPSDIAKEIPAIRPAPATDGVFIMTLDGRIEDDVAVTLSFFFRAGARCALAAEINQDQEGGHRYRRALLKYEACRDPSDRDFCSKHPNVTWADRELRREMVMQAYQRCGTVNTFYSKERSTGEPPPPRSNELRRRSTPCDGLVKPE